MTAPLAVSRSKAIADAAGATSPRHAVTKSDSAGRHTEGWLDTTARAASERPRQRAPAPHMLAPETGIDASPVEPVSTEQGTEVFRHRVAPRADTAVQS